MKLKSRPFDNPVVCGSAPLVASAGLGSGRIYVEGERVSLRPDAEALHDELNAMVLGMEGNQVRVRALHSFYINPQECLVNEGDEFAVSPDEVFHVILPR